MAPFEKARCTENLYKSSHTASEANFLFHPVFFYFDYQIYCRRSRENQNNRNTPAVSFQPDEKAVSIYATPTDECNTR